MVQIGFKAIAGDITKNTGQETLVADWYFFKDILLTIKKEFSESKVFLIHIQFMSGFNLPLVIDYK